MPLPACPIANPMILQDGFSLQRMLDPAQTDVEGRQHARAAAPW
jgi:hypothetical protein